MICFSWCFILFYQLNISLYIYVFKMLRAKHFDLILKSLHLRYQLTKSGKFQQHSQRQLSSVDALFTWFNTGSLFGSLVFIYRLMVEKMQSAECESLCVVWPKVQKRLTSQLTSSQLDLFIFLQYTFFFYSAVNNVRVRGVWSGFDLSPFLFYRKEDLRRTCCFTCRWK